MVRVDRVLLGSFLVAVSGCGLAPDSRPLVSASSPIIGGTVDTGDPAVVLVYGNDPVAGGFTCTGALIAPRVVLSAGHCTNGAVPLPCSGAACGVGDPAIYTIIGGTDAFNAPEWTRDVAEVRVHPDVQLNDDGSHDVGVLILKEDAPVAPLPWQSAPDDGAYAPGTVFIAIGYGMDSMDPNTAQSGTKRSVALTVRDENPTRFFFGTSAANIFEGDSGGPAIANGVVIGTHSYGFSDASGQLEGADMRTDENAGFIASVIADSTRRVDGSGGCSIGAAFPGRAPRALVAACVLLLTVPLARRSSRKAHGSRAA